MLLHTCLNDATNLDSKLTPGDASGRIGSDAKKIALDPWVRESSGFGDVIAHRPPMLSPAHHHYSLIVS